MSVQFERALYSELKPDLKKLGFDPRMMSAMKQSNYIFCQLKDSSWSTYIQGNGSVYYAKYKAWFEYLESIRDDNPDIDNYLNDELGY